MANCNTCKANKVCNHDIYGFENCDNYIPENVVEVVRCKDCVHYTIINGTCLLLSCKEQTVRVYEDDYCSNGLNKRKVNYCTDKQNKLRHCEDCHEIC